MFSAVASSIFAARNIDKTQNGEVGRSAVALGQTAGIIQEIAKYDGLAAKTARSAMSVFSEIAKENKAFEYAGKFTKFAVNNVNPLICVSGGIKTMMSDDKLKTGITEAAALTTMFAGEGFVKKNYEKIINSEKCKNIITKISKYQFIKPVINFLEKHKLKGKASTIIKGIAFVAASMGSYSLGHEIGNNVSEYVKSDMAKHQKIHQMA